MENVDVTGARTGNHHESGDTSPTSLRSNTSSHSRNISIESIINSASAPPSVAASIIQPPPPNNTPATQSIDLNYASENLSEASHNGVTIPPSIAPSFSHPPPPHNTPATQSVNLNYANEQLVETSIAGDAAASPPGEEFSSPHFHENSTWDDPTLGELKMCLSRLSQAADDKHKVDPSKSVDQYFNEALAKAVKEVTDIKIDQKYFE